MSVQMSDAASVFLPGFAIKRIAMAPRGTVISIGLFPEKVGAGLLEDWIEAGHVSPGVDDVGDGGPIL